MQLLEIGVFDWFGFLWLYVVGYFEGNLDIDMDGIYCNVEMVVQWKQVFLEWIDVEMVLIIQFVFDVKLVVDWCVLFSVVGVDLLVYLGVVGLVKL